jgi:signal peptidase I
MREGKKKPEKSGVRESIETVVFALAMALFVMAFVVQSFEVPSGSMIPTLLLGDRILVDKFIFGIRVPFSEVKLFSFGEPKRGEIIVFEKPAVLDPWMAGDVHLVKRMVGLPGDTIEIVDKHLFVNGKEFVVPNAHWDDPGVALGEGSARDNLAPFVVPPHSYFMMGDNRDNSFDSRFWGFVPEANLTGRPLVIYWSWDITAGGIIGRMRNIRWGRIGTVPP